MRQVVLLALFAALVSAYAPREVAAKDKGGKSSTPGAHSQGKSGGGHDKTPGAHSNNKGSGTHSHGKGTGTHSKHPASGGSHHKHKHTHHKHHQHHKQKQVGGSAGSSTTDEGVGAYSYEGGDYVGKKVPKVAF